MKELDLIRDIKILGNKLELLESRVPANPEQDELLEGLRQSLEELHAAQEELESRHLELLAAHEMAGAERRRYESLFQHAPFGYMITDVHGLIREANDAAGLIFEAPPEYLSGKPISVFVADEALRSFRVKLNELQRDTIVNGWEVTFKRRNGISFTGSVHIAAEQRRGEEMCLRWAIRDISDKKNFEEMKSDFVRLVSHQLKTPVAQVIGLVNNMLSGYAGEIGEKPKQYLLEIERICRRNLSLITELLNVSRVERGAIPLRLEAVLLSELVEPLLHSYRMIAEGKGLALTTRAEKTGILVTADVSLAGEVLKNIMDNAIRFTERGEIAILMKEEEHTAGVVEISDTGIGIPAERLAGIFERENVLAGPAKPDGGTGLGLYIARKFMALQNGEIGVSSEVGTGSTFTLRFPLHKKAGTS